MMSVTPQRLQATESVQVEHVAADDLHLEGPLGGAFLVPQDVEPIDDVAEFLFTHDH